MQGAHATLMPCTAAVASISKSLSWSSAEFMLDLSGSGPLQTKTALHLWEKSVSKRTSMGQLILHVLLSK